MGIVNYIYWQEGQNLWLGYVENDPSTWALGNTLEDLTAGLRLVYRLEMDAGFDSDAGKALAESYENLHEALRKAGVVIGADRTLASYAKNNLRSSAPRNIQRIGHSNGRRKDVPMNVKDFLPSEVMTARRYSGSLAWV